MLSSVSPPGRAKPFIPVLLTVFAVVELLPQPQPIVGTLDGSWMLAAEAAATQSSRFGIDFVFTYGPFAALASRLFNPSSWGWVLLTDLLMTLAWLAPLLLTRRTAVMVAFAIVTLTLPSAVDARLIGALFGVAAVAIARPGRWTAVPAGGFALLGLAKISFVLMALPVMLLIDAHVLLTRRHLPLATAVFVGTFLLALLATGLPPAQWPTAALNELDIINGYPAAMQLPVRGKTMVALGALAVGTLLVLGILTIGVARRRHALTRWDRGTFLLAAGWCVFMALKIGCVRADLHMVYGWHALLLCTAVALAFLDWARPLDRTEMAAATLSILYGWAASLAFAQYTATPPKPPVGRFIANYARALVMRPLTSLSWLTPGGWQAAAAERAAQERRIQHPLRPNLVGTIDAVPFETAELIASGARYTPRPIPQSYSAYTPRLQRLDAAFFARSDRAPRTLVFQMGRDMDDRFPALAAGPSLPVIAQWYDLTGNDPLGLILQRREIPRAATRNDLGIRSISLDRWIDLPSVSPKAMVLGSFYLPTTAVGRLLTFVARAPAMFIDIRFGDGRVQRSRFVPGMAGAGLVLSPAIANATPEMADRLATAGVLYPGAVPAAAPAVRSFRLTSESLGRYAVGKGTVRLSVITLPPPPPLPVLPRR